MDNKKHQQTGAAEIKGQGAVGIPPPPSDFAGIQNRTEVETDNILLFAPPDFCFFRLL